MRLPKAWLTDSLVHCLEVNEPVLECSYGPIGRCVDDLALVIRCWLCEELFRRRPEIVPIKFSDSEFLGNGKKKIAVFKGNQVFSVALCFKNAISVCQRRLCDNADVVEYEFPQLLKINKLFNRLLAVGGNEGILKTLRGEDPEDYLKVLMFTNDHPYLTSAILSILRAFGQERIAELYELPEIHKPQDFLKLFQEIQEVTLEVIQEWDSLGIDALICPTFGVVAVQHGKAVEVISSLVYSYIWNLLGFCAGVVPVGLVDKKSACFDDDYQDILTKSCREVMDHSEGLPYSVQVVGLPFRDETVLNVMKRIEKIFDFHKFAC
jgi:fatty acid amide hydrolase